MNKPSVSIIIPVYNVGPYAEDCIRSVMRQTYDGKMECIIVDDCGTDESMEIVGKVIADYNGSITFNILHHTHNRGLSAARNTGMDAATGDYLFFLDSDDELTDDCIDKLVKPLELEWYDIVVGNTRKIDTVRNVVFKKNYLKIPDNTLLRPDMILKTLMNRDWMIAAWNKLYNKDFISGNQLYFQEGIIFEDIFWTFQIACLSTSLYAVNQITYIYKNRKESIMGTACIETRADSYSVNVIEMVKFAKNHNQYNESVHELIQEYIYEILKLNSFTLFNHSYRQIRKYAKLTICKLKKVNGNNIKRYFRDFHYLIPVLVASYWQYYIYYRIRKIFAK